MPMTTTPPKIYAIHDIPRGEDMADYLSRVEAVRGMLPLPPGTPDIPAGMSCLTFRTANDIELALLGAEQAIEGLDARWFYAGEIQSGGF